MHRAPQTRKAKGPQGTETVLVVEDDESVLKIASRTLEQHGYDVIEASSAMMALELAGTLGRPIDLLLTDVVMPDASGPALAVQLAILQPRLKLLYMSGYTSHVTSHVVSREGIPQGSAPLLKKPFTPLELTTRVREVLDG
jgi:two-component system cell cycle sensor histidine kinase/response regulator CckA